MGWLKDLGKKVAHDVQTSVAGVQHSVSTSIAGQKALDKKIGTTIAKAADDTTKAIKTVVKQIGVAAGEVLFAPLLIFKPVMEKHLSEHAVKRTGTGIHETTIDFAKHLGTPTNGAAGIASHFESGKSSMYEPMSLDAQGNVTQQDLMQAATAMALGDLPAGIPVVLNYLKELGRREQTGKPPLTDAEKKILAGSKDAVSGIAQAAKETMSASIKGFLFSWKGGLLLVGIIGVVVFVSNKK